MNVIKAIFISSFFAQLIVPQFIGDCKAETRKNVSKIEKASSKKCNKGFFDPHCKS